MTQMQNAAHKKGPRVAADLCLKKQAKEIPLNVHSDSEPSALLHSTPFPKGKRSAECGVSSAI